MFDADAIPTTLEIGPSGNARRFKWDGVTRQYAMVNDPPPDVGPWIQAQNVHGRLLMLSCRSGYWVHHNGKWRRP